MALPVTIRAEPGTELSWNLSRQQGVNSSLHSNLKQAFQSGKAVWSGVDEVRVVGLTMLKRGVERIESRANLVARLT